MTRAVWTVPNILSILRLASVPVFVWLFVTGRETPAVALYAVAAWTDFFDGFIARRTGTVSELGKLLDPLADRVFIAALVVALVARDALPFWIALAVVGRDLLVLSLFPLLERRGVERIQVNLVGKTATAALLFGLTWLAAGFVSAFFRKDLAMLFVVAGAVLYWVAAALYARRALAGLRNVAGRGVV